MASKGSDGRRDATAGFDVHDVRHRLKQLRDDGDATLFENRDGVRCPVCEEPFERVFSTEARGRAFPENDGSRFCLLRGPDVLHLFRH